MVFARVILRGFLPQMNADVDTDDAVAHTRPGINFRANSKSPLKWTEKKD